MNEKSAEIDTLRGRIETLQVMREEAIFQKQKAYQRLCDEVVRVSNAEHDIFDLQIEIKTLEEAEQKPAKKTHSPNT